MEKKKVGIILCLLGLALIGAQQLYPYVMVIIDDTPPTITPIVPTTDSIYSTISEVSAHIVDSESFVKDAWCILDGQEYILIHMGGGAPENVWTCHSIWAGHKRDGSHTFMFRAKNRAGLVSEVSGTYTIYTNLAGNWSINDKTIQSSSQTVILTTRTLTFKFVKISGIQDSMITCTVEWSGSESGTLTLENTQASTWTGTRTFVGGTYTIDLTADDGMHPITLTIFQVDLGGTQHGLPPLLTLIGMALIVAGAVIYLKEQRKKQ